MKTIIFFLFITLSVACEHRVPSNIPELGAFEPGYARIYFLRMDTSIDPEEKTLAHSAANRFSMIFRGTEAAGEYRYQVLQKEEEQLKPLFQAKYNKSKKGYAYYYDMPADNQLNTQEFLLVVSSGNNDIEEDIGVLNKKFRPGKQYFYLIGHNNAAVMNFDWDFNELMLAPEKRPACEQIRTLSYKHTAEELNDIIKEHFEDIKNDSITDFLACQMIVFSIPARADGSLTGWTESKQDIILARYARQK